MVKSYFDIPNAFEEFFEDGFKHPEKRSFSFNLWTKKDTMQDLIDILLEEYIAYNKRSRKLSKIDKHKDILNVILSNLLNRPRKYIAISLDKNTYKISPRYNPANVSYTLMKNLIEFLAQKDYIDLYKGTGSKYQNSYRTHIKATDELADLFFMFDLSPKYVSLHPNKESIQLKRAKKLIDYEDSRVTKWRRDVLIDYSTFLNSSAVIITLNDETIDEVIDTRSIFIESFNRGGRVYGGFWQNIPKSTREQIKINDEDTVEIDINNASLRMAYHLSDINPPVNEDLYCVNDVPREVTKLILQPLLNSSKRLNDNQVAEAIIRGHKYIEKKYTKHHLVDMVRQVKKHFCSFGDEWFYQDKGMELQKIEADICLNVIKEFTKSHKAVLTIHDSYIVKESDKDILIDVLKKHYKYLLGYSPILTIS